MKKYDFNTFQNLILNLQIYWSKQGCTIVQPLDIEVGAGTFHPLTFLSSLDNKSFSFAYVQPSRRPTDGRYGENTNRLQKYYQFQVIIKPSPNNFQDLYIKSLKYLNIDLASNDIKFIEDNWENPTLGASGVGWEIWLNGIEITQFTYFQQIGGIQCKPIIGEITYGLERLAMHLQNIDNVYDIIWDKNIKYGDLFHKYEIQQSFYNFKSANINTLCSFLEKYEEEIYKILMLDKPLIIPAYELLLKIIHLFNLIDARKFISVNERQKYILRIRNLTKKIATLYFNENQDILGNDNDI